MAHFGSEELIDSLRHGFSVEDETGFSTKILGKAARRCKPGGLPLTFAIHSDSSDSDHSPPFQIHQTEAQPTSILCQQSLAKKTKDVQNVVKARRNQKPELDQDQIDYYFSPRTVPTKIETPANSLLSRQIEENKTATKIEKFSEYAKFEAFDREYNSKLIQVVFPFADHPDSPNYKTIAVRVKSSASMEEFVGLCCFLYTRSEFTPKCLEPSRYSIYMADDISDVDTELPPIDKNRSVGECGFPIVALVESKVERIRNSSYIIHVYTISGQKFTFELTTLNESLEWLRDEAVKRRQETANTQQNDMRQIAYDLQILNIDQPLKLSNTISSTGYMDFLLIRKNSSRGNFNPLTLNEPSAEVSPRAPLFVQTKQRPSDLRQPPSLSLNPSPRNLSVDSPTTSIRSGIASPATLGCGNVIQEYFVDRVNRLKRSSSKLAIRDDCLELTPIHVEKRRAFISQPVQKYTTIAWELIAGVESERHGTRRLTRICWLPISPELFEQTEKYVKYLNLAQKRANENFYQDTPLSSEPNRLSTSNSVNFDTATSSPSKPTHSARPSVNEGPFSNANGSQMPSDFNPLQLIRSFDGLSWKFIQIDSSDDDSWQISMKILEIIDAKNSIIRQLYYSSNGGSRRPKAAAEEMFNSKGANAYSPSEAKRQSMAVIGSTFKKRKSINPAPLLNRLLSKQD